MVSIKSLPSLQTWMSISGAVRGQGDSIPDVAERAVESQRAAFCSIRTTDSSRSRQHLLAIDARQRQGDLGLDHAELHAQVEARPAGFEGQVALSRGRAH